MRIEELAALQDVLHLLVPSFLLPFIPAILELRLSGFFFSLLELCRVVFDVAVFSQSFGKFVPVVLRDDRGRGSFGFAASGPPGRGLAGGRGGWDGGGSRFFGVVTKVLNGLLDFLQEQKQR